MPSFTIIKKHISFFSFKSFTSNDNSSLIASSLNYQPNFNTVEKIVELYERLVQAEKDKVTYLEELLKKK